MAGILGALGAGILQSNKAYQDAVLLKRQKEQQDFENQIAAQRASDAHSSALMDAILKKDQVAELPKVHARADVEDMLKTQGSGAYDNPAFIKANEIVGTPLPTRNVMSTLIQPRVNAIEGGPAGSAPDMAQGSVSSIVPSQEQLARKIGVAPNTGAVIPPSVRAGDADLERKQAMDDIQLRGLQQFEQGGGYDVDANTGLPANTPANRAKEAFDPLKRITTMYGTANEMPANVAARDLAAAGAKAQIPSQNIQKVTGQMAETVRNLRTAQGELSKMYPGIDATQTRGNYDKLIDPLKAAFWRQVYNHYDSPYNKAIQAAALGNVQEWQTLTPGRLNPTIIRAISEHQGDYGHGQSPANTYSRNEDLINMLEQNRQDLLTPQVPQRTEQPATAPAAPKGPLSVAQVEGRPGPAASPQAAKPAPMPAAVSHTQTPLPLAVSHGQAKPPVPWNKVVALARAENKTPEQIRAEIYAAGGTVVKGQ